MLNHEQEIEFCRARRESIGRDFDRLNPEQRRAVLATEGPLLLLAGAGSGKTTVLIHRIANLIRYGRGSDTEEVPDWASPEDLAFLQHYAGTGEGDRERMEKLCAVEPAAPWSILAITFTNKAAGELKERLAAMLGPCAEDIWAGTFHRACTRILRRDIDRLGLPVSFTIYDTDDSLRVIKDCLRDLNIDDKQFPPRSVLGYISRAKDAVKLADEYLADCEKSQDFRLIKIAKIYCEYQRRLWEAGALDFDDIILHTVRLLQQFEDLRTYYQRKFRYVLIDEYQDTNNLQYLLASTLAGGYENFCVVGDDDQSIYRFRGATIENILSFENQYKACRTIRLEENYRSTGHILEAANAVIRNNKGRKGKELWTKAGEGELLTLHCAETEDAEARYVAARILEGYEKGIAWHDNAILYRMNVQSNQLERACKQNGIPYRIVGGVRFYDRAEVKDMVAYLSVIHNPGDELRLLRIINNPPRGIGQKTIETAQEIAHRDGVPLFTVVDNAGMYLELERAAAKLSAFSGLIGGLTELAATMPLDRFYEELMAQTGYAVMLETRNTVEDRTRLENVQELLSSIRDYVDRMGEEASLGGFLDEISLYTDLDSMDTEQDCVTMMTMHAAKGLEFPVVFLVGAEEGIFPGIKAIGEQEEMEEERRLCYVAMTRAKRKLYITCAGRRMIFGHTSSNLPSRFVEEIPPEHMERTGRDRSSASVWDESGWRSPTSGPARGAYGYSGGERHDYLFGNRRPAARTGIGGGSGSGLSGKSRNTQLPDLRKGDTVMHKAFGRGMILAAEKVGGDALLEVAFDKVGTKRLMLKSAAAYMHKIEG